MSTTERTRYTIRMTEDESKELALLSAWLVQQGVLSKPKDNDTVNTAIKLMNDLVVRPAVEKKLTYVQIVNILSNPNNELQDAINRVEDSIQVLTLLNLNQFVSPENVPVDVKIASMHTTTTRNSKVAQAAAKLREMYQNVKVKRINDSKVDRL